MLPSADAQFNYAALPAEKAASARAAAERIRGRLNAAFIETGRDLAVQKDALGHGNFLKWIEAEFGLGERSAQHLMNVAHLIDSNPNHGSDLENLSARALRTLAAPSTPEPVRTEVLERAANGEKVTAKEIEALKRKLAKAEETIAEKESQRLAQENRASIAAKQAGDAANRAMFAEADKERLAHELEDMREEITRLKEPGVITLFNEAYVAPAVEPTPWTDDDAQFMTLQSVWSNSSPDAQRRFMEWLQNARAAA